VGLHCVADANSRKLAEDATADVSAEIIIETRPKKKTITESTDSLARMPEIEDVLTVIFITPAYKNHYNFLINISFL
jgi:hypothetical protein